MSLTEPLRGDWKFRLRLLFSYWHRYCPSLLKSTWDMLKVAELVLEVGVFRNESEALLRMNVPPRTGVELEQVKSTFWPQAASPSGLMEILAFGKFTEKQHNMRALYVSLWPELHLLWLIILVPFDYLSFIIDFIFFFSYQWQRARQSHSTGSWSVDLKCFSHTDTGTIPRYRSSLQRLRN